MEHQVSTTIELWRRLECNLLAAVEYPHPFSLKSLAHPQRHRILPRDMATRCSACGTTAARLQSCPCHLAAYCNAACQEMHWELHHEICVATRQQQQQQQQ
eukprot:Sspe_Gene.68581::Locus_40436_Transcript_1_4_Confidence_0.231_Length_939::g.68581::m.68581